MPPTACVSAPSTANYLRAIDGQLFISVPPAPLKPKPGEPPAGPTLPATAAACRAINWAAVASVSGGCSIEWRWWQVSSALADVAPEPLVGRVVRGVVGGVVSGVVFI